MKVSEAKSRATAQVANFPKKNKLPLEIVVPVNKEDSPNNSPSKSPSEVVTDKKHHQLHLQLLLKKKLNILKNPSAPMFSTGTNHPVEKEKDNLNDSSINTPQSKPSTELNGNYNTLRKSQRLQDNSGQPEAQILAVGNG